MSEGIMDTQALQIIGKLYVTIEQQTAEIIRLKAENDELKKPKTMGSDK
jgi:hypothetical protein